MKCSAKPKGYGQFYVPDRGSQLQIISSLTHPWYPQNCDVVQTRLDDVLMFSASTLGSYSCDQKPVAISGFSCDATTSVPRHKKHLRPGGLDIAGPTLRMQAIGEYQPIV